MTAGTPTSPRPDRTAGLPITTGAGTCPRCGGPNECAMASSAVASEAPCWCTRASFSAALLASLAPGARGTVCLCARCAVSA